MKRANTVVDRSVQPRSVGRPKSVEPRSFIGVRVPTRLYDQAIKLSAQERTTVSELVRSLLILRING